MEKEKEMLEELRFVLSIAITMKDYAFYAIKDRYPDDFDKQSHLLFSLLTNFIGNIIVEISPDERVKSNLLEFTEGLKSWMDHKVKLDISVANHSTVKLKKEDLH